MLLSAACVKKPSVSDFDAPASVVPQFPADQYEYKYQWYATLTPEEIVSTLTLDQKAAQIVQPLLYMLMGGGSLPEGESEPIRSHCYGSIYADEGMQTAEQWREILDSLQQQAIESEAGISLLVAEDDVHGVGYCIDGVYFPHSIGQGAANDEEQVVSALNCGIDVFMEGQRYDEARQAIIDGVNDGTLSKERRHSKAGDRLGRIQSGRRKAH